MMFKNRNFKLASHLVRFSKGMRRETDKQAVQWPTVMRAPVRSKVVRSQVCDLPARCRIKLSKSLHSAGPLSHRMERTLGSSQSRTVDGSGMRSGEVYLGSGTVEHGGWHGSQSDVGRCVHFRS